VCLAASGQIISLEDDGAIVAVGGRRSWASTALIPDLQVGQWVLISGVTVLDRLTVVEAATLANLAWAALQGVDAQESSSMQGGPRVDD
jgi:hydrogenase maturation factor